jgi:two-component system, cell cycle sensor histidine kinase and response regulator CckA
VNVLLVDDDEGVRDYTAHVLEDAGFHVRCAAAADEAEALVAGGEAVDLLITDIVMPGRDGIALARWLNRACPGAKVLFTTGYTRHIAPELLADADILDKPYQRDSLLHAIRHVLGR